MTIKPAQTAEWSVLGAMMTDQSAVELFAKLSPADFPEQLQDLASCLFDGYASGNFVDMVSAADRVENSADYDWRTIFEFISDLFCPPSIYPEYIRLIKKSAKRRKLLEVSQILRDQDIEPEVAAEEAMAMLESDGAETDTLYDLRRSSSVYLHKLEDRIEHPGINGIPTGFKDIDYRILGFKPQQLIVIAGRPGMGKSTLARNIGMANAREGKSVLMFSMEMSADEHAGCLISSVGEVAAGHLLSATLTDSEWPKVTGAVSVMKDAKFFIDDEAAITMGRARARCYEIKRKYGLDLVMFDYLQLMEGPGKSRYEVVSEISRGLKKLAKNLGVPVIALSQLSRSLESRTNKRPILSDLRESGQIEQDADIIMFAYRDKIYDEESKYGDVAEIITGKFRGGRTGTDYLRFEGEYSRFSDLDYKFEAPLPDPKKQKHSQGMEL